MEVHCACLVGGAEYMLGHENVCAQTRKDYLFDQVASERSIFEAYGIKCKLALSIVFIDLCVQV